MADNTAPEMKPTLGLTGLTMNAMALIAPGAFLWLTFYVQATEGATGRAAVGAGQPSHPDCRTSKPWCLGRSRGNHLAPSPSSSSRLSSAVRLTLIASVMIPLICRCAILTEE